MQLSTMAQTLRTHLAAHRDMWGVVSLALLIGTVVLLYSLWPSGAKPRARQYVESSACLLTDEQGVTGRDAKPVWSAMQTVSNETLIKVEYLTVRGPQTPENAATFLASLTQGQCDVILAVGPSPVKAITDDAPRYPRIHFGVVGADGDSGKNLTFIATASAEAVKDGVAGLITDAIGVEPGK